MSHQQRKLSFNTKPWWHQLPAQWIHVRLRITHLERENPPTGPASCRGSFGFLEKTMRTGFWSATSPHNVLINLCFYVPENSVASLPRWSISELECLIATIWLCLLHNGAISCDLRAADTVWPHHSSEKWGTILNIMWSGRMVPCHNYKVSANCFSAFFPRPSFLSSS